MKKDTILFALLLGMILLAFEAVPQIRVFSQSTGCTDMNGRSIPCPPGSPGKPGPKDKKPTGVPPTPVLVGPTLPPVQVTLAGPPAVTLAVPPGALGTIVAPIPTSTTPTAVVAWTLTAKALTTQAKLYPYLPQVPPQNLCKIGPCWPFNINPGDPVEMLAGGGFLAFLIVIGVAFFRGRSASGGGGGAG